MGHVIGLDQSEDRFFNDQGHFGLSSGVDDTFLDVFHSVYTLFKLFFGCRFASALEFDELTFCNHFFRS